MATLVGQKKGKNIEVSTDGQRLIYSASREYLVYDQSGTDGEGDILLTAGLPSVNLFYNFDGVPLALTCKKKSAQQWENNNKYWTVTADFDNQPQNTEQGTGGNEQDSQDPTTWYGILTVDFETFEEVLYGEQNFAKRPYSPPLTISRLIPVIKWTQYLPPDKDFYDILYDYHDKVNENRFLRGSPRFWLLAVAGAEFGVTNGYQCWRVNFELRYKKTDIDTDIKVYSTDGTDVTSSIGTYPGWDLYIPQIDTIDINKRPFTDIFENSGEAGKLGVDGLFLSDQDEPFICKRHLIRQEISFSFIRIRQNTT